MNRNVLMLMKNNGTLPTLPPKEKKEVTQEKPFVTNKYNPDITGKYNQEMKDFKSYLDKDANIDYKNEIWKGITGEKMVQMGDKDKPFEIKLEKPDYHKIQEDYEKEFRQREDERRKIEERNKLIQEQSLNKVMKMVDEICDDNTNVDDVVTFDELKITTNTEHMKSHKEDYNKLLEDISKL